MKAIAGSG